MICEFCKKIIGHDSGCPNCIPPKAVHFCYSCGQGIYNGEHYVKNEEYRHYNCVYGIKDLLEWLAYEVKTMDENYEENC